MSGFDAGTWGERVADVYEQWLDATPHETDRAVDVLADLAGGGRVLELAIGSGRVALPLAARGVDVHGVDASPAMLDRLREQPGGEAIPVSVGNFADMPADGLFRLIYVVFQTFHVLGTQAEQVRCFENVATHLVDDGMFVLETNGAAPGLGTADGEVTVWNVEPDRLMLGFERRGDELQAVTDVEAWITEERIRLIPMRYRYTSPVELDLMARLAGLRLLHRWGGWEHEPPVPGSRSFVSVYAKDPTITVRPVGPAPGAGPKREPADRGDDEAAERLLAELAEGGPVLRLGAETGPAEAASAKVVFCPNAFEAVDSAEDQLALFERAAGRLAPDGLFVVRAAMPQPSKYADNSRIVVKDADADRVVLEVSLLDRAEQRVTGQEVELSASGVRLRPTSFRYAWPTELDLMARVAGLQLVDRWSGWDREPFTHDSPDHVSVYARG